MKSSAIHVSSTLSLPLEALLLPTVVYGVPDTGKSTFGRVLAEEAARAGIRFCVIDRKGDHWGLKSSADGKSEGLPVVVFGGDHADIPLNIKAGAVLGETIAHLSQSTILDFEHFDGGADYFQFLADFARSLYHHNRESLVVFFDEAQEFIPQNPDGTKEAKRCLAAMLSFAKLGRKHALGRVFMTQRGSDLNKGVSEICEMLVSFRAPGTLDQDRVKKWLGTKTSKEKAASLVATLNDLPRGTALFACAHPAINEFGVHAVRRPETFDSSATPELGKRRAEPTRLAKPALDALRASLAKTIEAVRLEDPKALQAALAEERALRVKAEKALAESAAAVPSRVEVPAPVDWERLGAHFDRILNIEVKRLATACRNVIVDGEMMFAGKYVSQFQVRESRSPELPDAPPAIHMDPATKSRVFDFVYPKNTIPPEGWTMKEEALYQKIKARLIEEAPSLITLLASGTELEVQVTKTEVTLDGSSLRGRIARLLSLGFMNEAKTSNAIVKELSRTGPSANGGNVHRECEKLLAMGLLTKESDGYQKAPGAKVRIKEEK